MSKVKLVLESFAPCVYKFYSDNCDVLKPDLGKPYGEVERYGKTNKSDRKRAPKWRR